MNIMGLDIGTSGCKATVFDQKGNCLKMAYHEYDIIRDLPGQAELDARDVWKKVCDVIRRCTVEVQNIAALSVTSMGEAMVPINRNGEICGNSVLGCDTRGARYLDHFINTVGAEEIYRITGQPAGIGYALPNLCRIMAEEPDL